MGGTAQKRRRRLGVLFLLAALAMLVAGETLLKDRFSKAGFLVYWLACLGFTLMAMVVAWLDALAIRQRSRIEQREFLEETLREIARKKRVPEQESRPPDPEGGEQKPVE
jgi:uncharacterized membrane protein YcjF (UPF0283 family)